MLVESVGPLLESRIKEFIEEALERWEPIWEAFDDKSVSLSKFHAELKSELADLEKEPET